MYLMLRCSAPSARLLLYPPPLGISWAPSHLVAATFANPRKIFPRNFNPRPISHSTASGSSGASSSSQHEGTARSPLHHPTSNGYASPQSTTTSSSAKQPLPYSASQQEPTARTGASNSFDSAERSSDSDDTTSGTGPSTSTAFQEAPQQQPTYKPISLRAAAAGLAGFLLISYDVFSPSSSHLLLGLDAAGHALACSLPEWFRHIVADSMISDLAILFGVLGWIGCTVAAAVTRNARAIGVMAFAWSFGAGPREGDVFVVEAIKNHFHRIRPDPLYHPSFSYPSGHTSASTFLVGALLFVLIPVFLQCWEQQQFKEQQSKQQEAQTQQQKLPGGEHRSTHRVGETGQAIPTHSTAPASATHSTVPAPAQAQTLSSSSSSQRHWLQIFLPKIQRSWPLWCGCAVITGAGRVLADAHWVTDTMSGACLSLFLVSVLSQAVAGWDRLAMRSQGMGQKPAKAAETGKSEASSPDKGSQP